MSVEDKLIESAIDIFTPVMEAAVVYGAAYGKACGRTVLISEDMKVGLKFAIRTVTGNHIGRLFPELWDDSDDDEEEEEEVPEEEEPPWTRYVGDDEAANRMNECLDTWDAWEPTSPAEHALKNSVIN